MFPIRSSSNRWGASLVLALVLSCRGAQGGPDNELLDELAFDKSVRRSAVGTTFADVCTARERWKFEGNEQSTISEEARKEFELLLKGRRLPYAAFAEVIGRTGEMKSPEARAFAQYWRGRALYSAKLYSEAASSLNQLISQPPNVRTLPFQKAAIACLDRIHEQASHISYSDEALDNLIQFYNPMLISESDLVLLSRPAVHFIFKRIQKGNPQQVNHALLLVEESGHLESLVRAMWAVRQRDMETASHYLKRLLAAQKLPSAVEKRRNELRLLLATALYETEDYQGAIEQLEAVDRRSNELVDAIARLASAHLMQGNLSKAIGTAVVLNSGDFRRTFVPEIYMVMAMGLNEFCRYPEAYSVLNDFKRQYQESYRWLSSRIENDGTLNSPLYPEAVRHLKGEPTQVPVRILSEWVRSSVFQGLQHGINSLFDSVASLPSLEFQVQLALQTGGEELAERENQLRDAVAAHRESGETAEPEELLSAKKAAEAAKARFTRLDEARDDWDRLIQRFRKEAVVQKKTAVVRIEKHLKQLVQRMHRQLTRVVENNELVEAEVLAGASRDIILKNAARRKEQDDRRPAHTRYTWRAWGEAFTGIEVWEDEVGSLEASIQNNCPGKSVAKREEN